MESYAVGERIEDPASGEYGEVIGIEPDGSYRILLEDSKTRVWRSAGDLEGGFSGSLAS